MLSTFKTTAILVKSTTVWAKGLSAILTRTSGKLGVIDRVRHEIKCYGL